MVASADWAELTDGGLTVAVPQRWARQILRLQQALLEQSFRHSHNCTVPAWTYDDSCTCGARDAHDIWEAKP